MGNGKKRAFKTIERYRSALTHVFALNGSNISHSECISDLFRNFSLERPVTRKLVPQWSLTLVLRSLIGHPYEPILNSSLENLTYKALFLLALATSKRRSEIHAFSMDKAFSRFSPGLTDVTLLTEAGFFGKEPTASGTVK